MSAKRRALIKQIAKSGSCKFPIRNCVAKIRLPTKPLNAIHWLQISE